LTYPSALILHGSLAQQQSIFAIHLLHCVCNPTAYASWSALQQSIHCCKYVQISWPLQCPYVVSTKHDIPRHSTAWPCIKHIATDLHLLFVTWQIIKDLMFAVPYMPRCLLVGVAGHQACLHLLCLRGTQLKLSILAVCDSKVQLPEVCLKAAYHLVHAHVSAHTPFSAGRTLVMLTEVSPSCHRSCSSSCQSSHKPTRQRLPQPSVAAPPQQYPSSAHHQPAAL